MTHAERKSDCKYEVEREGRKRKRMRVRNEGENRLKKPLWNSKNLSLSYKRNFLQLRKISLSHTHTHAPLSFFVDWYSPFFSPETCRALLLPWCVSAVCSPCVCVCIHVSGNDVLSRTFLGSYILMSRFVVCRCLLYEQRTEVFWDCVSLWRCVCAHVCLCVCFSSLISVYFQSLSQLSQLLSVFLSFLCVYVYQMLFGHKQWRLRGLREDMCPTHLPPWEEK